MLKRTLLAISAATMISAANAQSDGRDFDAAIVMVPGLTVERNGVIYGGDWTSGLLQAGDIVRSDQNQGSPFQILTSDGSVVGINPNSEILMDGSQAGWNVFQVTRGAANVVGNVHDGYRLSSYFAPFINQLPRNIANVTPSAVTPGYVPSAGGYSQYISPYSNVVNTPAYGVIDPYGIATRSMGNFYVNPYKSGIVISSPWWWQ